MLKNNKLLMEILDWFWIAWIIFFILLGMQVFFSHHYSQPVKTKMTQVVKSENYMAKPVIYRFRYKQSMEVPDIDSSFHSYMSWRAIKHQASAQYAFRQFWRVNRRGLLVYKNPYTQEEEYVIALGQYYSCKVGERFEIEFDNGQRYRFVTGDIKQNAHTDQTNRYRPCGQKANIVEFLVNLDPKEGPVISHQVQKAGSLSVMENFNGKVVAIKKLSDSPWLIANKNYY